MNLQTEQGGLTVRYKFPPDYIIFCKKHQSQIEKAFNHKWEVGDFFGTGCTCDHCCKVQTMYNNMMKPPRKPFPWLDDIIEGFCSMLDEREGGPVWYPRYDQLFVKAWSLGLYTEPDGNPWDAEDENDPDNIVSPMGRIQHPTKLLKEIIEKDPCSNLDHFTCDDKEFKIISDFVLDNPELFKVNKLDETLETIKTITEANNHV